MRGKTVADAIVNSVTHIGPAIGIAIIAACLGFAALFFSPVPMIKDFGYMLIIGVTACYLVSIFILLTILYWRDRRHAANTNSAEADGKASKGQTGRVERGLQKLAPWVIRNPLLFSRLHWFLPQAAWWLTLASIPTPNGQSIYPRT
jgi:predicted RND superfamily exporter protein